MINNNEAEQSVLGAILVDGTLFESLILEPTHFGDSSHQVIYNSMSEVVKKGNEIDILTVVDELGNALESIGNVSYLTGLTDSVTTFENIEFHERLILESYQERIFKKISLNNAEKHNHEEITQTIKDLEELQSLSINKKDMSYKEILKEIAIEIGEEKDISQMGYKTGYRDFDRLTGGLQKSDLIIVGARPSVGKTAFGLNIGVQHCINGGTTHIVSMEMTSKALIKRLINMTGNIESSAWHSSSFSLSDYDKGINAIGIMGDWNMNIYENLNSVNEIKAMMRKQLQEKPEERHLLVIDYLGMFKKRSGFDRNDLEVGDNALELKNFAKSEDIPIVLLSQLNRGVEQRQDKRPMMSDLKDSGEIEQHADVVILLHREDYQDEGEDTGIIELLIRKQRDGPLGNIELAFLKEYGKFSNLDFKRNEGGY